MRIATMIVPGMTNQEIVDSLKKDFDDLKSRMSKRKKKLVSDMKKKGLSVKMLRYSAYTEKGNKWDIWECINSLNPHKSYCDPICEVESEKGTKDYYVLRSRKGYNELIKYTSHAISRMRERGSACFSKYKNAFEIIHNITTPYELNPFGFANIKELHEFIEASCNKDEINGVVATFSGILLVKKEDPILKVKTFFDFKTAMQTRNGGMARYIMAKFIVINKNLFDENIIKLAKDIVASYDTNVTLNEADIVYPIAPGYKKRKDSILTEDETLIMSKEFRDKFYISMLKKQ